MNDRFQYDRNIDLNPFQTSFAFDTETSVAFHVETSHLICTSNQMTGFYMKYDRAEGFNDSKETASSCLEVSWKKLRCSDRY